VSNGIESVLHIGARGEEAQVQSCVPESIGAPAQDPRLTHHVVAGQMSVAATMALIADAALVLSLDSAAAHMAVGLSVPIVSLYGASRPNIDGPYGQLRWCLHGGAGESLAARQHRDAAIGRVMMDRIQVSALVDLVSKRLAEPSA
jgi:ADP-heptose:LPS heptosyltransferase